MTYESWSVEWDMPVVAQDRFNRFASYSWGGRWGTPAGGTPDNYNVDGARGVITLPTGDTAARSLLLAGDYADIDIVAAVSASQIATGNMINGQVRFRSVNSLNFYLGSLAFDTSGMIDVSINRLLAGAGSVLGSAANIVAYTPDADVYMHVQARADLLRIKAWTGTLDDEPQAWTVEFNDSNFPSGQIGVRATISGGNTNVNPMVQFASFRATVPERWVDITSRVDTARGGDGGSPFTISAGDTPEASADVGGTGLPIQNSDQAFTPGNVNSIYYPNIRPGRRIRIRETISDKMFGRLAGRIQYPEITAWTQSTDTAPRDQLITIPVVDEAAWIAQGRKLIGTLAEHIMYNAGPSMVAYWPLNESSGPAVEPAVGGPWTLTQARRVVGYGNAPDNSKASITYGNTNIAPGDDGASVLFSPALATSLDEFSTAVTLFGPRPTSLTLDVGQVATLVCWTRASLVMDAGQAGVVVILKSSEDELRSVRLEIYGDAITGSGSNVADWGQGLFGPPILADQPIPVGVRVGFSPPVLELWVRGEVYTDTMSVITPTPAVFDQMEIGGSVELGGYPGAVAHVQVYIGAEDDWTHEDFLAQREVGLRGLERQSTGERIRAVLGYAGVDPARLGRIDDGTSLMQAAQLVGRSPIDVVAGCVETEQGEFYADGDGEFVFADRIRLYNA